EVERDMHGFHIAIAGPGVAAHFHGLFWRHFGTRRRRGDDRLYRHDREDFHILFRNLGSRRYRVFRHTVGIATHLRAVMLLVAYPDPRQVFLRNGARIAGDNQAQREAVQRRNILVIHGPGDQRFRLHGLFDRHAARDHDLVGIAGNVDIVAIVAGIDG